MEKEDSQEKDIYKFTKKYTLTDMNVCLCVCVY